MPDCTQGRISVLHFHSHLHSIVYTHIPPHPHIHTCPYTCSTKAYIETVSSPKTVAVVNLNNGASPTAGDGGADSYQVMEILLNMTLSDQDQITLFSPGLNFTGFSSFVPANQENINLILDRLSTSASSNDSSLRLLSEGIELLLTEADASCYHALVVLLDSELLFSDVLQNMIANASQNSDKLTVFLYILDTLSPEDFTNASRRFCDSRTVIETLGGTSGTWLRSLLVNYMNYFYYGEMYSGVCVMCVCVCVRVCVCGVCMMCV